MVFRILVLSLESFVLYCSKMSFPPIERKIVVFLNSFTEKIDFLYMDHMETSEEAAILHFLDAKLVVDKNLISENGIILIDDIGPDIIGGKGKYSIPYLLDNGYKIVMHEYQVLMIRDNTDL